MVLPTANNAGTIFKVTLVWLAPSSTAHDQPVSNLKTEHCRNFAFVLAKRSSATLPSCVIALLFFPGGGFV